MVPQVLHWGLVRPRTCRSDRYKVLTGVIADRTKQLFRDIAERWGFEIISCEVMPDHIHLFVSAPPKYSPSKIAQLFKGTTSRVLQLEFPQLEKLIYKKGTLWSPSYYVGSAGNVSTLTMSHWTDVPLAYGLERHCDGRRSPDRALFASVGRPSAIQRVVVMLMWHCQTTQPPSAWRINSRQHLRNRPSPVGFRVAEGRLRNGRRGFNRRRQGGWVSNP